MADDGSTAANGTWPLVKFSFQVTMGGVSLIFQEVSGLSSESQVIEYRGGSSKVFSTIKMPGIQKFGNVTLKKGIVNKSFRSQLQASSLNTIKRSTVVISLLDESSAVATTWKLINAFPVKIIWSGSEAEGNEVAIETMELAHEGLSVVV